MKKTTDFLKTAVCPLLILILASGVLASCKKEKTDEMPLPEEYEENTPLPTADQIEKTYIGKTAVIGTNRSAFNVSVVNRMKNVTAAISSDVKAVVFTASSTVNFTEDETAALLKAYVNGANFVFINPVFPDFEAYKSTFNSAVESLLAEDISFDLTVAETFYDKLCEMKELYTDNPYGPMEAAAFRYNSSYIVPSLVAQADLSDVSTSGYYSKDDETDEANCASEDYEPTAYDYGKAADILVEWMAEDDDPGFNSSEADSIEKYMSGKRTVIQHKVGPSRALGRTLSYEMVYTVYSAYDFDKNTDYYFIRLEPKFYCSSLGCQSGDDSWVSANKVVVFDDGYTSGKFWSWYTDLWYGPYMSKFDYTAKLVDGNGNAVSGVILHQANPHTDVSGTSSVSTGMSWNLSGNVGFNMSGPLGGVAGGFAFSESHSYSQNSLKVYLDDRDNTPNWRIEGIVPQCHTGFFSFYHDEVATFQKSNWQTEFTWIVSIPNPQPGNPFYISATDLTEITELNYNRFDIELRVHPTQSAKIELPEPNRSKENYTMSCSDQAVQDIIKDQFGQTWQNEFTYYALNKEQSDLGAKAMFEKVKVAIKGYGSVLKDKGYTGTYTFALKQLDGTPMDSFTIENGEVK
jgi:hypothetical protein